MHLPKQDVIATALVAAAGLLYLLWAVGSALPGMSGTRVTGIAVLALGFAASASAVVPTFDQLLHGNRTYLAVTSLIGLVAVIGGVQMLVTGSGTGLAVVMAAMVVLWLIATIHHSLQVKTALPSQQVGAQHSTKQGPRPTGVR
jgi:predicted branched-subunit amino acid permease